jgi:hypothetical protein
MSLESEYLFSETPVTPHIEGLELQNTGFYIEFPPAQHEAQHIGTSIWVNRSTVQVYFPTIKSTHGVAHVEIMMFREVKPNNPRGRLPSPACGRIRYCRGSQKEQLNPLPDQDHPLAISYPTAGMVATAHFNRSSREANVKIDTRSRPFGVYIPPGDFCNVNILSNGDSFSLKLQDFSGVPNPHATITFPNGFTKAIYPTQPLIEWKKGDTVMCRFLFLTPIKNSV